MDKGTQLVAWSPAYPDGHRTWVPGPPDKDALNYWGAMGWGVVYAYTAPPALYATPDQVAELEQENRLLRARNERLEKKLKDMGVVL